jgi:hypothetical protein
MSILYKASEEFTHSIGHIGKTNYLPIKNPYVIHPHAEIFVHHCNEELSGICAIGRISDYPKKVRELDEKEREKCSDTTFLQLPVIFTQYSVETIIEDEILFQFPSLNQLAKIRPTKYFTCREVNYLSEEITFFLSDHWWYFTRCAYHLDEGHYKYWIHQLREKWLTSWKFINYKRIIYGKSKCEHCGLTTEPFREYYHDFLELHETVKIDFKTEYIKIVPENFVILCPNCHKMEHEKIKNENIE